MPLIIPHHVRQAIVNAYLSGHSLNSMRGKIAPQKTIERVLDEQGFPRPKPGGRTRYKVNETYFSVIDTPEKAYWLGFMYGDGNVTHRRLNVGLALKDECHVQALKTALGYTGPLSYEKPKQGHIEGRIINSSGRAILNVARSQMAMDLAKLGCVPAKTFVIMFPSNTQVPEHLLSHFLRGNLDADGTISSSERGTRRRFCVHFLGTKAFVTGVGKYLTQQGLNLIKVRPKGNIFKISIQGHRQVLKLRELLYHDCTICLERKKSEFDRCAAQPLADIGPKNYLFCRDDSQITINNLAAYCRDHGLNYSHMHAVIAGKRNHHKGYHFVRRL